MAKNDIKSIPVSDEIIPPFVRSPYNYDAKLVSVSTGLFCEDESLTVQADRDDADINVIVKRFGVTGILPQRLSPPTYGDFTGINDYQSALNAVINAEDAFMQFPADVRSRFKNDPQSMLEFLADPANRDEAISLGLIDGSPATPTEPSKAAEPSDAG